MTTQVCGWIVIEPAQRRTSMLLARRCLWLLLVCAALAGGALAGDEGAAWEEELDLDRIDLSVAGEAGWSENAAEWHLPAASAGARQLLAAETETAKAKHSAVHAAAVKHAAHKREPRARNGAHATAPAPAPAPASKSTEAKHTKLAPSGVSLPKIPQKPPVCSVPPAMRFCKNINYPVYRPDNDHTFADLDFDSHAVFKKIVPHMRISERHFELPVIHQVCN